MVEFCTRCPVAMTWEADPGGRAGNSRDPARRSGAHLKRVWDRILQEPDRAPQYIALAAAERFGPQAEEWVRIAGPGHTQAELARVAFKKTSGWRGSRAARRDRRGDHSGPGPRRPPAGSRAGWSSTSPPRYGFDPNHPIARPSTSPSRACTRTPAQAREGARRRREAARSSRWRSARCVRPSRECAPPQAREVRREAAGTPLRRPAHPVHRRADRCDAERKRHDGARPAHTRLLRRRGAPADR